nr:hypothetical protein CFP56_77380 [Quercus suber]
MEKGTSQFCQSAGRCGAMRRVMHAGMPLGCPLPASLGEITSFSKKHSFLGNNHIFRKSLQICEQAAAKAKALAAPMGKAVKAMACLRGHASMPLGAGSRALGGTQALACTFPDGVVATRRGRGMPLGWDAKRCRAMRRGVHACSNQGQGSPPWEHSQGMGMRQPRPRQPPMGTQPRQGHAAANAWACGSQGQGSPPWARSSQRKGMQQPWHGHAAAKAKAAPHGHVAKARACGSQGQGSLLRARSSQGKGMQQLRYRHAAAKAKVAPHGHAAAKARACNSQGMGMRQPRPR